MSCGVQWPATNTGSSHSSAATGHGLGAADGAPDRVDPRALAGDEVQRRVARAGGLGDRADVAHRLAERRRVQRDDPRLLGQLGGDAADVVVGDRAHRAQLLGDDQVGLELGAAARLVERVDRLAALGALADGGVDLRSVEARRQHVARDLAAAPAPAGSRTRA